MKSLPTSAFGVVTLVVTLLATGACSRRHDACGDASTTSAELAAPAWTRTPWPSSPAPEVPSPAQTPRAPPDPRAVPADRSAAATPASAAPPPPTPAWVPDAGRLTVVQAPDLARNLGIAPAITDAAAPTSGAAQ